MLCNQLYPLSACGSLANDVLGFGHLRVKFGELLGRQELFEFLPSGLPMLGKVLYNIFFGDVWILLPILLQFLESVRQKGLESLFLIVRQVQFSSDSLQFSSYIVQFIWSHGISLSGRATF